MQSVGKIDEGAELLAVLFVGIMETLKQLNCLAWCIVVLILMH